MKVHIEDLRDESGDVKGKLFLESDTYQFILREYTGKSYGAPGKETEHYITHGNFSSIESALRHVAKMKIKDSTAQSLQELIADIRRIEKWLQEQLKDIA